MMHCAGIWAQLNRSLMTKLSGKLMKTLRMIWGARVVGGVVSDKVIDLRDVFQRFFGPKSLE